MRRLLDSQMRLAEVFFLLKIGQNQEQIFSAGSGSSPVWVPSGSRLDPFWCSLGSILHSKIKHIWEDPICCIVSVCLKRDTWSWSCQDLLNMFTQVLYSNASPFRRAGQFLWFVVWTILSECTVRVSEENLFFVLCKSSCYSLFRRVDWSCRRYMNMFFLSNSQGNCERFQSFWYFSPKLCCRSCFIVCVVCTATRFPFSSSVNSKRKRKRHSLIQNPQTNCYFGDA